MSELPPLPQGYALDAVPPLPAGYQMDSAPADIGTDRAATVAALRGIPIAGAYADKGAAYLNAAAQPLMETGLSHAGTFSERAAENEKTIKAATDQREKDHPIESAVEKLVMGAGALGPLGETALGARALGMTGETLAARAAAGAASGAGIGGVDAAARGENPIAGAATGAALGGVIPAVAHGVGAAYQSLATKAPEIAGSASPKIMRAIKDDALDAPTIKQKLDDLGPEATLADLGPNLRTQAEAVAAAPGPGQKIVMDAMTGRADAAGGRIEGALDQHLGPSVNPTELTDQIVSRRKAQAAPLYDEAYKTPIVSTPEINSVLDTPFGKIALQKAQTLAKSDTEAPLGMFAPASKTAVGSKMTAAEYQDWLAANASGKPVTPQVDVRGLDLVKRSLDDMHDQAQRAGANNRARVIDNLRTKLIKAVDTQAPKYGEARNVFSTESGIKDALENGRKVFSRTMSPDELGATLRGMSGAEHDAFTQGARSAVADLMGSARNDAGAARALFDKGWTREKLDTILGNPVTDALFKHLEREGIFHDTSSGIIGNSRTAARLAAGKEFPSSVSNPTIPHGTTSIDAAMYVPRKVLSAVAGNKMRAKAAKVGSDAAKALTATGPARDEIVRKLLNEQVAKATTAAQREQLQRALTLVSRSATAHHGSVDQVRN